ncbi:BUD22-domain-containing protein [Chytriomyces sp. MP71]|nr:BUD22-domain-containing protein [Chytriomyces sp. MP71]
MDSSDTLSPAPLSTKAASKLHHILRQLHRSLKKCKTYETQRAIKKMRSFQTKVDAARVGDVPGHVLAGREKELRKAERDWRLVKEASLADAVVTSVKEALAKQASGFDAAVVDALCARCDEERPGLGAAAATNEGPSDPSEGTLDPAVADPASTPADRDRIQKRLVDVKEYVKVLGDALAELRKVVASGGFGLEFETGVKRKKEEEDHESTANKKKKVGTGVAMSQTKPGRYVRALAEGDEGDMQDIGDDDEGDSDEEELGNADFDSDPEHYVPPKSKFPAKPKAVTSIPSKATKSSKAATPAPDMGKSKGGKMESSFVTNLNDGFSDVSLSDLEVDEHGRKKKEVKKKNRMGQRARRDLWEKEFGREANHVKNRAVEDQKAKAAQMARAKAPAAKTDEKVHPSWAAKKAQRQSVAAFSGSKITFGGDDDRKAGALANPEPAPALVEKLHPSWAAKKALSAKILSAPAGNKVVFGDDEDKPTRKSDDKAAEKLHPSWAAKRKQSAAIDAAAGKKTVFGKKSDADDRAAFRKGKASTLAEETEKLHPSWAAKKKQSAAIGGAQGTKVVFGDD